MGGGFGEPSALRALLIRSGFAKARRNEYAWLRRSLVSDAAGDRLGWSALPGLFGLLPAWLILAIRFGDLGYTGMTVLMWLSGVVGSGVGLVVSLRSPALRARSRRVVLRRHGMDGDGKPSKRLGFSAGLTGAGYTAFHVALFANVIGVSVVALSWLTRPWTPVFELCSAGSTQLVASGVATGGGGLDLPPRIEWVELGTGDVVGSARAERPDPGLATFVAVATPERPVTSVMCRAE